MAFALCKWCLVKPPGITSPSILRAIYSKTRLRLAPQLNLRTAATNLDDGLRQEVWMQKKKARDTTRGDEPRRSTGIHGISAMSNFPAYPGPQATRSDWMHTCARVGDALLEAMLGKSSSHSKTFTRESHYDKELRIGEAYNALSVRCETHTRLHVLFVVYTACTDHVHCV